MGNTMIHTAYALLTGTVLLIMGVAVLVGGIAGILTEFSVVAIVNKLISPLMKPLYGLPGASIVGGLCAGINARWIFMEFSCIF